MQQTVEPPSRSVADKLGIEPEQRVEVAGDLGVELRRELRDALGRGFVRSGPLDAAVVLVESLDEAERALAEYRPRLHDDGCLWLVTPKRGHERYVDQLRLVQRACSIGLIDNKTCSLDAERSGVRLVIPRALRAGAGDAVVVDDGDA